MSAISRDDGITADSSANDFSHAQMLHIPNDAIMKTSGDSEAGEINIDSQENEANIITSSQQTDIGQEPYKMRSSQLQPVSEPNDDSRRDSKRERSISEECGTRTEKRMRCNADGETVSVANLAIQRVEEGRVEEGRVEEEPARHSAEMDLACELQATAS